MVVNIKACSRTVTKVLAGVVGWFVGELQTLQMSHCGGKAVVYSRSGELVSIQGNRNIRSHYAYSTSETRTQSP